MKIFLAVMSENRLAQDFIILSQHRSIIIKKNDITCNYIEYNNNDNKKMVLAIINYKSVFNNEIKLKRWIYFKIV